MNLKAGAQQITANKPVGGPDRDVAFEAWLNKLPFAVDFAELGQVRAGFEKLAAMNRLNRISSSPRLQHQTSVDI